MISKTKALRSAVKNPLSPGLKFVKYLHDFMIPVFGMLAVICLLLCFFEPTEGSNSAVVNTILLVIAVLGMAVLKIANNHLREKNRDYKIYQTFITRKLDWSNALPLVLMTIVVAIPFYILVLTSVKTPLEATTPSPRKATRNARSYFYCFCSWDKFKENEP